MLLGFLVKKNLAWFIIPMSVVAGLYLLQELHVPVNLASIATGRSLLEGRLLLISVLLAGILVVLNLARRILKTGFYLDEMTTRRQWTFMMRITGLDAFTQAGEVKRYIWLEVNLLIRTNAPGKCLA
nr:hypothetical protein [Paraflavitalea speifideiaquila]